MFDELYNWREILFDRGRKLLKRSDEVMLNYADDGMLITP